MLLLTALLACSPSGSPGPKPVDHITQVIAALDASALTAAALRDNAIAHEDKTACLAWTTVMATAPVASDVLMQVKAKTPSEIPAISFSADKCVSTKPVDITKIQEYMTLGVGAAEHIVASWTPTPQECVAHSITESVLSYVKTGYVPVLKAIDAGVLDIKIPAQPLVIDCK